MGFEVLRLKGFFQDVRPGRRVWGNRLKENLKAHRASGCVTRLRIAWVIQVLSLNPKP